MQYVNKEKLKPVSHKAELIKTEASGQVDLFQFLFFFVKTKTFFFYHFSVQ